MKENKIDMESKTVMSEKGKTDTNANKIKQHISTLWKNTLNSRRQAFFQYYNAKNIAEIFTELLKENFSENVKEIFTKNYTKRKQRRNSYKTAAKFGKI